MVCIGTVVKPHGLQGEFSVDCRADTPFFFEAMRTLYLGPGPERLKPYEVRAVRVHKGRPMFKVAGVADRDQAEALRGLQVHVPDQDLPPAGEDEIYLAEVLGLEILLAGPDGPTPLGKVVEIMAARPEQEIWIIRDGQGREILFPAVDEFVAEVDMDNRRVVIDPPPGLLDLYLAE